MLATPIEGIKSDRIGGIRFEVGGREGSVVSLIGVYLPCVDKGINVYREHLLVLEEVISESERHGPVVVVGDFNAHLGEFGGPKGKGQPNVQGV